jgi:hypothetical protein
MRPLVDKIKPARGFSGIFHNGLLIVLPVVLFVLARLGEQFVALSFALILLSKWRMFAVRPRFWPAIIRANSVDIIVGISLVIFMQRADSTTEQLIWTISYAAWLLFLKPRSTLIGVSLQAFVGQLVGLMALFLALPNAPIIVLVLLGGTICSVSARHFFDSFDEPYSKMLAYLWGYVSGALIWVLSHWLLFYGIISQPALLLTTIGYGLAALYYFDHNGRLNSLLRRQFVFLMLAIVVVIIMFSDWGDKVV